jgi:hypothetical protein
MSILVNTRPIFQRAMRVISSITQANPAVITTTTNHQYITGMIIRVNIPKGFGMQQVNQQQGEITVLSNTTFSIDLDTTLMDPFLSLINLGTTDGSGNISGTISTNVVPFSIGQSFSIGNEVCLIISSSGSMYCSESASGTFSISTGIYSISGAAASTTAYFNQVLYPLSYQFAQVTPVGENNDTLQAATQNVLGTGFYN